MEIKFFFCRLRDEVRALPCTYKCRHDAAADLIHVYAHTKCFFKVQVSHFDTGPPTAFICNIFLETIIFSTVCSNDFMVNCRSTKLLLLHQFTLVRSTWVPSMLINWEQVSMNIERHMVKIIVSDSWYIGIYRLMLNQIVVWLRQVGAACLYLKLVPAMPRFRSHHSSAFMVQRLWSFCWKEW